MLLHRCTRLLLAGALALVVGGCGSSQAQPSPLPEPTSFEGSSSPIPPSTATTAPPVHLTAPGEFAYTSLQRIFDCHTGRRAAEGGPVDVNPGCDSWPRSELERPMDAQGSAYSPRVDILMAEFGEDADWYYARIYTSPVEGSDPASLFYALELDTDLDGVGEFLLLAGDPSADVWQVSGVQVWRDDNGDVAGEAVGQSPTSGDGYESSLFDQGAGDDPDLAWARVVNIDSAVVELGFKKTLLDGPPFAWWGWASATPLDPAQFELVDRADPSAVFLIDNTCAWTFGRATVAPPNACPAIAVPTAAPAGPACVPPPEGCAVRYGDPCYLWYNCACVCFN